jgi:hypothetical protein
MTSRPKVPWFHHYDQQHLSTIALPLGGIGTGTVARRTRRFARLGSRQSPRQKVPPRYGVFGSTRPSPHSDPITLALEGPARSPRIPRGVWLRPVAHHGLPRFRECSFDAAYPFGVVHSPMPPCRLLSTSRDSTRLRRPTPATVASRWRR